MKLQNFFLIIVVLTSIFSCKNDAEKNPKNKIYKIQESKFSEVKKLSEFKNTKFIPTLEYKISKDKNSVYCATLLFAWDEIRNQINAPLTISDEYTDLILLNQSNSFGNVLKMNEYKVSGEIEGNMIKARAEFNKSLPFKLKLDTYKDKLTFNGQKVSAFGVSGYDDYDVLSIVKIVYYKNDNNFIIKLIPMDFEHEIILFKTNQFFNSMAEMTREIEKLTEIGMVEMKNEKINWKYIYNGEDRVVIPKFNFNIETNYNTIEGNKFNANKQDFLIGKAWQRTAFILDENGAEIESEVIFEVVAPAIEEEFEKPKPKKMFFDKPFLILLKRTDTKNPYFGLWITNSELMMKE